MWPTEDYTDVVAGSTLTLLRAVMDLEITEQLREALGKTYSPNVANAQSRHYPNYGTFTVTATVEPGEAEATSAAIRETVEKLRAEPPSADIFQRARQPLLERLDNLLKTNAGWMSLIDRAQSQPDTIERYRAAKARYQGLTPADVRAMAVKHLDPARAVEIVILPAE